MAASAFVAFATLGDGKLNREKPGKSLLSNRTNLKPGSFSLQSGYVFRGSQVINSQESRYVNLNSTVMTYQQGHTTYVLPIKKKVAMNGKLTFNPNASTRN